MTLSLRSIFGLEGKKALVTGSSRGIGAAIARGLSAAGAQVLVHARTEAATRGIMAEIVESGGIATSIACDLADCGAGRRLALEAEDITGGIDVLIVNASSQINAPLTGLDSIQLETQLAVNLGSTVEMLQILLPRMAKRGWGRVVNIGSINQSRPKGIVTAYAALKAAQHNVMQSQAREYAERGVLLNTLAPGLVDTDRNRDRKLADPAGWQAYARELNWMKRAGRPEELVGAAIFLSSDACSFMTGEAIFVTGGC